jgi:hypothetical protein
VSMTCKVSSHTPTLFTAPASWLGFPHEFYAAKCISNAVMMEEDLWCDWETILRTQRQIMPQLRPLHVRLVCGRARYGAPLDAL